MPHVQNDGPPIYFETSGDPRSGQPLVLIAGAGAQLIWWREEFVAGLHSRGFFVIRIDNRDVGFSARFGGSADTAAAYTMKDMADDICRVLDELELPSAHIVGQSLGGGIAQVMAINHPSRVKSLVLFFTVPAFDPRWLSEELQHSILGAPAPSATPPSHEEAIAMIVEREQLTRSTAYRFDEAAVLDYAARAAARGYCPGGAARQAAAAATSLGDLSDQLEALKVPTAIIHGREDRLLRVAAGFELGRLISDSELHIYPGMGHEIVAPLWPEFTAIISRTSARAK